MESELRLQHTETFVAAVILAGDRNRGWSRCRAELSYFHSKARELCDLWMLNIQPWRPTSEYISCKSLNGYGGNLLISACSSSFCTGPRALYKKVLTLCSVKPHKASCQGLSARTITHFTKSVKPIIVHSVTLLKTGKAELIRPF